jgi:hypothetical protein
MIKYGVMKQVVCKHCEASVEIPSSTELSLVKVAEACKSAGGHEWLVISEWEIENEEDRSIRTE